LLVKFLPIKRKFLIFRSEIIVPVFESCRSFLLEVLSKLLEGLNFNELLNRVPGKIWEPLFKRVYCISLEGASKQEVHLLRSVIYFNNLLLHDSEHDERQEDLFVLLEETTRDPLIYSHSDHFSKSSDSWLFIIE
jgi:hypothetical protein